MRLRNQIVTILCLFLAGLTNSCLKADITYDPLDPDFLSYFAFKEGSWWTYKEVGGTRTDSVYVSWYGIKNLKPDKWYGFYHQELGYELISRYDTSIGLAR